MPHHPKTYAGFWSRAAAFTLDSFVVLGYLLVLTLILRILRQVGIGLEWLFTDRVRAQVTVILILTLPVTLYFAFGESSVRQATWGKQRLRLRVIDGNGDRIHFLKALTRTVLKFVPWELSHTLIWEITFSARTHELLINYGFVLVYALLGLNIASLIITKTHRTLYDFLVGTYVVKSNV